MKVVAAAADQVVPIALVFKPLVDSVNAQLPSLQSIFFLYSQNQFLLLATNIPDLAGVIFSQGIHISKQPTVHLKCI